MSAAAPGKAAGAMVSLNPRNQAASVGLPAAVGTSIAQGHYLNTATAHEPVAVLGAAAGLLPAIRAARMSPTQALWTV